MNALGRASLAFGIFLLMILQAKPEWAQDREASSKIRFGMSSVVIEPEVNPTDALAAAKIWADLIGKNSGLLVNAEAHIISNPSAIVSAVNRGDLDIVALATDEYLEIKDSLRAIPSFTWVSGGQVESQYLILVRKDSGINTMEDLRGRRIAIPKGGRASMVPLWLDVLLYDSDLPQKESYFREIKMVQKSNQSILPIFFKQMDAGIALRSTFEMAVTLNPQIGQQLKILASSPKLVLMVTCVRESMPAAQKQHYISQALKLHETPGGSQGFQLFKLDRLVPWDPSYENSVRELLKKKRLAASSLAANSNQPAEAGKQR